MMKFIVDTQLPPRLANFLTSKGYESIHTSFLENGHLLDDKEIVLIAKEQNRTIISKDSDFLDNYLLNGSPPKILLVEFGNISNKNLLELFNNHLTEVLTLFKEGFSLVVFRMNEIIAY